MNKLAVLLLSALLASKVVASVGYSDDFPQMEASFFRVRDGRIVLILSDVPLTKEEFIRNYETKI